MIYPVDATGGVYSVFGGQWSNNGNPAESDVSKELTIHVDQYSGQVVGGTYAYADYSALAKTVSQGIALHEGGRRFGPVNTMLTTLFCLAVIFLCLSAPIMWWDPAGGTASGVAAPPGPGCRSWGRGSCWWPWWRWGGSSSRCSGCH